MKKDHRGFAFLDDIQQAFFVQSPVVDQGLISALAEFNSDNVGLVRGNLISNGFNRGSGNMSGPQQAQVGANVHDGGFADEATSIVCNRVNSEVPQKVISTFSRICGATVHNSRRTHPLMPATMLAGITWIALLKLVEEAL